MPKVVVDDVTVVQTVSPQGAQGRAWWTSRIKIRQVIVIEDKGEPGKDQDQDLGCQCVGVKLRQHYHPMHIKKIGQPLSRPVV